MHSGTTNPATLFFFNDTATTEIYTLSLHDALPISHHGRADADAGEARLRDRRVDDPLGPELLEQALGDLVGALVEADLQGHPGPAQGVRAQARSEEHTSELQSHLNLVCRLLLEKKK